MAVSKVVTMEQAVASIADESFVGLGGVMFQRKPLAVCRALAARHARELHCISFTATLDAEILVAAGCVSELHAAYVGLDRLGRPPAVSRARASGLLHVKEYSEWMILMGYQAGQYGLPFWPSSAPRGSDLVAEHGLKTVRCPYTNAELLALPAIRPDVAILHAWRADERGNIQWPWPPDGVLDADLFLARAASRVIVSVEEIVPEDLVRQEARYTRLAAFEVDMVVAAPGGASPGACRPTYDEDWAGLMKAVAKEEA